jgi:hypothetical protein
MIQQKVLLDHYRACGQEANDSSATSIRETINSRVIPTLRSKMAAPDVIDLGKARRPRDVQNQCSARWPVRRAGH